MYAVYHGPEGLRRIARRVASYTAILAAGPGAARLRARATTPPSTRSTSQTGDAHRGRAARAARDAGINLRRASATSARHHARRDDDARRHRRCCGASFAQAERSRCPTSTRVRARASRRCIPAALRRTSAFLTHPVFNTPPQRDRDAALHPRACPTRTWRSTARMIPLGSCTMKLNATSEMIPITWPEFAHMHPFAPRRSARGLRASSTTQLRAWLCAGDRLRRRQPAAQRRLAGRVRRPAGDPAPGTQRAAKAHRNICLIPSSAHGTNPASAQMAGMQVVVDDVRRRRQRRPRRPAAPSASSTATSSPR